MGLSDPFSGNGRKQVFVKGKFFYSKTNLENLSFQNANTKGLHLYYTLKDGYPQVKFNRHPWDR